MDASPLTPEQKQQLEEAKEGAASFTGAAKIAAFNGWTFGFFAVVSILFGLFSIPGLLVGIGLGVIARNEFVGRQRILAYDPSGFELLWRNQIGLMAVITAYCVWAIYRTTAFPDPALTELTELMGEGFEELIQQLTVTMYVVVIGATLIFQGLNSRYYFVRIERLREFLDATPTWAIDLQRSLTE